MMNRNSCWIDNEHCEDIQFSFNVVLLVGKDLDIDPYDFE